MKARDEKFLSEILSFLYEMEEKLKCNDTVGAGKQLHKLIDSVANRYGIPKQNLLPHWRQEAATQKQLSYIEGIVSLLDIKDAPNIVTKGDAYEFISKYKDEFEIASKENKEMNQILSNSVPDKLL